MKTTFCPVPLEQIPIKEYKVLSESFFFNWPLISKQFLYKKLIYSWLIILPITSLINYGSNQLNSAPIKLIAASLVWSLILPLFLLLRHILSWSYIYKRLKSEVVEYEESGWYDGQIWEKNIEMREKDLLTAQHEIKPILKILKDSLTSLLIIFVLGIISTNFIYI